MTIRAMKLFSFVIVSLILIPLVGVGIYLFTDYIAYRKVEITSLLLRDGKYDPARHFTFDRACVFPTESSLASTWFSQRGYRELDTIFPDTFTHWTLVLIDDSKKTFRTLYALEPKVQFGGQIICNPTITLQTKVSDGHITAYVDQANAH